MIDQHHRIIGMSRSGHVEVQFCNTKKIAWLSNQVGASDIYKLIAVAFWALDWVVSQELEGRQVAAYSCGDESEGAVMEYMPPVLGVGDGIKSRRSGRKRG